jgi:hypothetical protein
MGKATKLGRQSKRGNGKDVGKCKQNGIQGNRERLRLSSLLELMLGCSSLGCCGKVAPIFDVIGMMLGFYQLGCYSN